MNFVSSLFMSEDNLWSLFLFFRCWITLSQMSQVYFCSSLHSSRICDTKKMCSRMLAFTSLQDWVCRFSSTLSTQMWKCSLVTKVFASVVCRHFQLVFFVLIEILRKKRKRSSLSALWSRLSKPSATARDDGCFLQAACAVSIKNVTFMICYKS